LTWGQSVFPEALMPQTVIVVQ